MFWVLVSMAMAVFSPCVLLPVWREYQALAYAEQIKQAELVAARSELAHQQRRLAALQNDPAAIARLARRELGYQVPNEITVPVSVPPEASADATPIELIPAAPPAAVAWLTDRLPDTDYDRLFCTAPTRTLLMCLSGGLMIAALIMYAPRRRAGVMDAGAATARCG
ncbi:MAG: hypothetical protein GY842_06830 [bacterium]|nr:hypothetical protein [bacterium]